MSTSLRVFCFTEDGALKEKACCNPIEVASLDMLRPGVEDWARNAGPDDAAQIEVTNPDVQRFNAIRADDRCREQIARRLAGRCYEVYKVLYTFEKHTWDYKSSDIYAAIGWQALGYAADRVPDRFSEPDEFAALIVRWVPDQYPTLPLVVPVPLPEGCVVEPF